MLAQPIEGIVENGQIRLKGDVQLPENTKVYVLLAEASGMPVVRIRSPRWVNPQHARDFEKQIIKG